ncbi:MAG: hypothetical protein V4463_05345 [Pseudomonadota bacterium]
MHRALEDARDLDTLHHFCANVGCDEAEVRDADGKRLDILKIFDAMRARGYTVAEPKRSQTQCKRGFTTWGARITLPCGTSFILAFFTPD